MKQSFSLAILLVTLLCTGLALFYWFQSNNESSAIIPVDELPHILPITKPVDASCTIAQRYLPDAEPVVTPQQLDWPAVGLGCPRIIDTPHGRELWFWWIDDDEERGIGRALWSDGQWNPQPTPTMLNTDLPDTVSKRFGCPTLLYEEGTYRMWIGVEQDNFRPVFYAESKDAKEWDFYENNPVLGLKLEDERYFLTSPFVTRNRDAYDMVVRCGGKFRSRLCHATSDDGINWTMNIGRLLYNKPKKTTEIFNTPFLLHDVGDHHLLFTHGWSASGDEKEKPNTSVRNQSEILHTSSPTGQNFDFLLYRPLLIPGGASWRSHRVESPFLTREEDRSVLYFTGSALSQIRGGSIGRAISDCAATIPYPTQMTQQTKRTKHEKGKNSPQELQ